MSIDEILGMEGIRKEERLHLVMDEIYTLARSGDLNGAIEQAKENLRLYPDNGPLLMALGEALARKEGDRCALEEAIAVSERVLEKTEISMKARITTVVNLLFLYLKAGRTQEAEELVKSLPHIWEIREMVMPEVYEGEEYREELKKAVRKALIFLCLKIDGWEARAVGETPEYVQLGVEFEKGMSEEEMVRKIRGFLAEE